MSPCCSANVVWFAGGTDPKWKHVDKVNYYGCEKCKKEVPGYAEWIDNETKEEDESGVGAEEGDESMEDVFG